MTKAPHNAWDELMQIINEFRYMHARINGETRTQAAKGRGMPYSVKMESAALTRWNCQTPDEYKSVHPQALRTAMSQIRETAIKTVPNTRLGQQLIISHEYLRMMLELTLLPPEVVHIPTREEATKSEHRTREPKERSARKRWNQGSCRSRKKPATDMNALERPAAPSRAPAAAQEDPQAVYVPPLALRRVWAHLDS